MADLTHATHSSHTRRRSPRGLGSFLGLYRQRQALARLDPHLLRDIGVDGETAQAEASRPIWDVPQSWRF